MKTQYVTNSYGKRVAVILPLKDYEKIINDIDEIDDIRLYDEVKKKNEMHIPFDQYLMRRKKNKYA